MRLVWRVRSRSFSSDIELHHIQLLAFRQPSSSLEGGLVRALIFSSRILQGGSDRDRQIRRLDMIVIVVLVTSLWDKQSGSRVFQWVDHGYLVLLLEPRVWNVLLSVSTMGVLWTDILIISDHGW